MRCTPLVAAGVVAVAASSAAAIVIDHTYAEPTFDRWNYPFASPAGDRETAPVFSDGGFPDAFDLRDGQFLNTYQTGAEFPVLRGASNYLISSATVSVTVDSANGYVVGGTAGQAPLELFGTGFRFGYTPLSYGETAPFTDSPAGIFPPGQRNAFAADINGADASNNPFASPLGIGSVAGKTTGDAVVDGDVFTFELDLNNPQILAYLQEGLNVGVLSFSIASLEAADFQQQGTFPDLATKENDTFSGVTLSIEADVIPAPAGVALLPGLALLAGRRRR